MPVVPRKSSPDLLWDDAQTGPTSAARRAPAVRQGIRMHNITVLSGGMGGARFLQGLLHGIAGGTAARGRRPTRRSP